jgi:hypothetical protein
LDTEQAACLRSCLMKPEHHEWLDPLWHLLSESMNAVLAMQPS